MADATHIEWTDATWNPITGCSVISPGCTNCYAMRLAGTRLKDHPSRQGLTTESKAGPVWNGEVRFNEQWIDQPLSWSKPRRIFVCAHSDLFHENVPDAWIDQVFARMALTPHHVHQVLTKRAERMRAYCNDRRTPGRIYDIVCDLTLAMHLPVVLIAPGADASRAPEGPKIFLDQWPLPNVWLGVSVENQVHADKRIPLLLDTPAALRWISAEPLLGPLDLLNLNLGSPGRLARMDALRGHFESWSEHGVATAQHLDWVVVGGERGDRPMHPDWARQIRDDCAAAGVPFFFKQYGDWREVGHDMGRTVRVDADSAEGAAWLAEIKSPKAFIAQDGRVFRSVDELPDQTPCRLMERLGKRRAGRTLDGVTHDAFPTT